MINSEYTGEKRGGEGIPQKERDVGGEVRKSVWVESLVPGH